MHCFQIPWDSSLCHYFTVVRIDIFQLVRKRTAYANEANIVNKLSSFYSIFSHDFIIVVVSLSKLVSW